MGNLRDQCRTGGEISDGCTGRVAGVVVRSGQTASRRPRTVSLVRVDTNPDKMQDPNLSLVQHIQLSKTSHVPPIEAERQGYGKFTHVVYN